MHKQLKRGSGFSRRTGMEHHQEGLVPGTKPPAQTPALSTPASLNVLMSQPESSTFLPSGSRGSDKGDLLTPGAGAPTAYPRVAGRTPAPGAGDLCLDGEHRELLAGAGDRRWQRQDAPGLPLPHPRDIPAVSGGGRAAFLQHLGWLSRQVLIQGCRGRGAPGWTQALPHGLGGTGDAPCTPRSPGPCPGTSRVPSEAGLPSRVLPHRQDPALWY